MVSEDVSKGVFVPLVYAETAVPVRRAGVFATPREGGDVIIRICEGLRDIKITKKEKAKVNGKKTPENTDEEDDSDVDDEDEEEEIREKVWKVGTVLAEAAVKGVKKGGKVEVTVNITADMVTQITAREVGGKGGVRGELERTKVQENGSASG